MDAANSSLPDNINPNIFPAKLWRLVNNPADGAIRWDSRGEVIVINRQLFETQILSPGSRTSDGADTFKTTNFSSFVRQLNLYGFKKVDPTVEHREVGNNGLYHFHNPNFQRSYPQLLEYLVRLTVDNKAKLKAGQDVSSRLPNRYQGLGFCRDDKDVVLKGRCSLPPHPSHQSSAYPYHPNKPQAMRPHSGTPVPPRYLRRVPSAALSPTNFPQMKEKPMPLRPHYTGVASSSKPQHVQQGFLPCTNNGNTHFNSLQNSQCQPGYYPTVCHCFHPSLGAANITGLQTGMFSPRGYYQVERPVTVLDFSRDLHSTENQEVKKTEVNLDVVFQIADEVMQTLPSGCLVKVETIERPVSVPKPYSDPNDPISSDDNTSARVTYKKEKEELMVSVPGQMAEDAIYEVPFELDDDAEIISVEVRDTVEDSSKD